MLKTILFVTAAMISSPAFACDRVSDGEVRDFSNERNIYITDRGTVAKTSEHGGNSWHVKTVTGEVGAIFSFIINVDQEQTGMLGVNLVFHTDTPVSDWEAGYSQKFKTLKLAGNEVNELKFGQFACGAFKADGHKIYPGYFESQIWDKKGNSMLERTWYLDANSSTATLTAVADSQTSDAGEMTLSGVLNLVYVNPLSEKYENGGKLNLTGPQREIEIELDEVQFIKRN